MLSKLRKYPVLASIILLVACSSSNQIVKSSRGDYQINNTVSVDSAIIKTYLPYKVQIDAEMNKVIGYAAVDLTKASALPESVLGNFFADAVANQVKNIVPDFDVVFPTSKGGLRNDIAKGPITVSNIFELMPFENQLVLFELNGSDVLKLLNSIAKTNGQPLFGVKMEIQNTMVNGISVISAGNILIKGKPLDSKQIYRVITSDYLGNGGDNTSGFANPISRKNIGLWIRDALLKEVNEIQAAGKKVNAKLDGRITKN